jgi:hypothetical protein
MRGKSDDKVRLQHILILFPFVVCSCTFRMLLAKRNVGGGIKAGIRELGSVK